MNLNEREKIGLLIVLVTAICILLASEVISTSLLKSISETDNIVSHRANDVFVLPKQPTYLPKSDSAKSSLLLIGNSHTYALPGVEKGYPLRPDPGATLIDKLAENIKEQNPQLEGRVNYHRLSYPNFLPYEMLMRVSHLIYHQQTPKIVVIGLTWRNIARDRELRSEIFQVYKDKAFISSLKQILRETSPDASNEILETIESEERAALFEEEKERTRSYADRLDEKITGRAEKKITLLGSSAELRARIFREFNYKIIGRLTRNADSVPQYDLIERDLEFNLKCLQALVKLLHPRGAKIVFYYAPERTDLPSLIDKTQQEKILGEFKQFAESQDNIVLDARNVVPNEYWGWDYDTPDRSHFTERGHKLLAEFIVKEAGGKKVWEALHTP